MRTNKRDYFMQIAIATAERSTCIDKQVGTVLTDADDLIIATGYNGSVKGAANCCETIDPYNSNSKGYCIKQDGLPCVAIHSEINALIQAGKAAKGGKAFVTLEPCYECAKALVNAGITEVYYNKKNGKNIPYKKQVEALFAGSNILYLQWSLSV
jgi:dCMP deaminase